MQKNDKSLKSKLTDKKLDVVNLTEQQPATTKYSTVINNTQSTLVRFSDTMQHFTSALQMSETLLNACRFTELQRIYKNVNDDSEVVACKQYRFNAIFSRNRFFYSGQIENVKATEFFSKKWFHDFLTFALDARFYGYSIVSIKSIVDDNITEVELYPRENCNPRKKIIMQNPNSSTGMDFTDAQISDWIIPIYNDNDSFHTGEFSKVAPYRILLRSSEDVLHDACLRFATPQVVAKTSLWDDEYQYKLQTYLSNLNNSSYAILDKNDDVQFVESKGSNNDIFKSAIETYKSNIKKILLGSESLGNEQSFVGSAEISNTIATKYTLADCNFLEYVVNDSLIPRLVNLGLTFLKDVKMKIDCSDKLDPSKKFEQWLSLINYKDSPYQIDPAEFVKEFGIPVSLKNNITVKDV